MKMPSSPIGQVDEEDPRPASSCRGCSRRAPGRPPGRRMTAIPNSAIAMPCSSGGKVWRRIACSVGCSAPAPSPCMRAEGDHRRQRARERRTAPTRPRTAPARPGRPASARRSRPEERGQRHDHDRRDHEPGRHPGDLLDGGAERAGQVRRGDVDDRRVDRPHQRAERDRQRDDPLVDGRRGTARPIQQRSTWLTRRPLLAPDARAVEEELQQRLDPPASMSPPLKATSRMTRALIMPIKKAAAMSAISGRRTPSFTPAFISRSMRS